MGNISFPGRTLLPSRGASKPITEHRLHQLDEFLKKVILWIKEKIQQNTDNNEQMNDTLTDIISTVDEFLEVTQLDRKAPCTNDKKLSCNMLHEGWFNYLWNSKEIHHLYCGFSTINCEVLSFLVENNKNIEKLDLTGASGGSLRNEGFRCLLQVLSSNETKIKEISLGGYQGHNCNNEDVENFFKNNKSLTHFYATGGISISVDDPLLAFSIQIQSLVVLDLSRCFKKQPKAVQAMVNLTPHLKSHQSLQELYLNENYIGNRGAELLAEALQENQCLRVLSLRNCRIGPTGLIALCNSISNNELLERLIITDRPSVLAVGAPSSTSVGESISNMIKQNKSLIELDLSRQYLGEACYDIIKALESNASLLTLRLRNNRFIASKLMNIFFSVNQSVRILDISHNDLIYQHDGDDNDNNQHENENISNEWCSLLSNDQILQEFSVPWLENSPMSSKFIEALSKNKYIKKIEFSSVIDCVKEIGDFFKENNTIEEIVNLQSPPKGLFSIHSSIISHPSLKRLFWINMDFIELRRFSQQLSERSPDLSPIYFTFTLDSENYVAQEDYVEILRNLATILPKS